MADRVVDAEELWGAAGRRLAEEVRCAAGTAAQRAVLESHLTGLLAAGRAPAPAVDAAVRLLYHRPAELPTGRLAAHLDVSPRLLQRHFPAVVGAGPKEFQRIARFQRLTRSLLLAGRTDYLPAALDAGYFDQSHVIREYRRIGGDRPSVLLGGGLSHFYYEPLDGPGQNRVRPDRR
ncbi:helix-turn-helix domain-containing protein [Kitasatospora aburaviensis]